MGFWDKLFSSAAVVAVSAQAPIPPQHFAAPPPDRPLTDADIIDGILRREGGFVNNPADKGGVTNLGITQATLAGYRGHPVTVDDVKNMPVEEARAIYQEDFISGPGFDAITYAPLRVAVIDISVNSSPRQAVILLQRAVGVPVDGALGPKTLAAANTTPSVTAKLAVQRCVFYGMICKNTPSQWVFYEGWIARAISLI